MNFQDLIKNICEEENVEYNLISEGWCFVLKKNNITKYILGYSFSLNDQALGSIINDKYALYEVCKLKNLPIIEHQILFKPNSSHDNNAYSKALEYFNKHQNNVVIKPNNGTEGNEVYHIIDGSDLNNILDNLFTHHYSLSICPFYHIDSEYRVIVLDGVVKLIFEKIRPTVIGDGVSTIKELLLKLNPWYFENIALDSYNYILKKDEVFNYDWRFNLSKGATAKLVENKNLYKKLENLALQITNSLNARFVSVDIINCQNNLYLLEINSRVCINKVCHFIKDDNLIKNIYKEAILKMFE